MEKYITQLLADIEAAKANKPEKVDAKLLYPDHPAIEYGLDYIAEWENAESQSMSSLYKLDGNVFPNEKLLNDQQIDALIDSIEELWDYFNIVADYPDGAPSRMIYTQLVHTWQHTPITYISEGCSHLDMCELDCNTCLWGEYCTCARFTDKETTMPDDGMLSKGIIHGEDGSIRWINPRLLDENGNFDPNKLNTLDDEEDLPF